MLAVSCCSRPLKSLHCSNNYCARTLILETAACCNDLQCCTRMMLVTLALGSPSHVLYSTTAATQVCGYVLDSAESQVQVAACHMLPAACWLAACPCKLDMVNL